jgi:cytoskeleton protein RodZ
LVDSTDLWWRLTAAGDFQVESFGARLRREREQRNITLDEISVSTKIGTRFLRALEEEQFDQLPGGIFNKSFVRAYARHLGIDEAQAVADFALASGASLPESKPEETSELAVLASRAQETGDGAGSLPWGSFAMALLVVAFGVAVWGFHSRERSPARQGAVIRPPVNVKASTATPQNNPQGLPAKPNGAEIGTASSAGSQAATSAPAQDSVPTSGAFLVRVRAREDSWVSISADGKQIMQNTLSAPAEKAIEASNEVVIKTGNVGALDISFNGKKLPSQRAYSGVKTLSFDPNGLRPEAAGRRQGERESHP